MAGSNKTKTVKVKMFAVIHKYPYKKNYELCPAEIEGDCGCCSGSTDAVGIYKNESEARNGIPYIYGKQKPEVVPCTVTYKIPIK